MKRLTALLVLCSAFAAAAPALELKDGRIKLVVDDRSGRFALYYLVDAAKGSYQPLMYDQETRTSYLTLYLDQRAYKLGESADFKVTVAREGDGIRVSYRSSHCAISQTFSIVASAGGTKDSLRISFSLENVSEKDLSIGLRMLLDTWLGEKSGAHFSTQSAGPVSTELTLSGSYTDSWVRSPGDSGATFQLTLADPTTRPDRVILANWKRLNDSPWSMETSPSRTFTLLPYSINDSAMAVFWDPVTVRKGSTRSLDVVLGNQSDPVAASVAATSAPLSSATLSSAPLDLASDLVAVREVLARLNEALASGTPPSAELLAQYASIIALLESRKEGY